MAGYWSLESCCCSSQVSAVDLHHIQLSVMPNPRLGSQGPTIAHMSSTSSQLIYLKGSNRPISHILCFSLLKSTKWLAQWQPCEKFSMNLGAKNLPLFNFNLIASIRFLSCLLNKLFCFFHSALSNSCQMESLFWEPFRMVFTPILFVFLRGSSNKPEEVWLLSHRGQT